MTKAQKRWNETAAFLREHNCSLRDGTKLDKLKPQERAERAQQIVFEMQHVRIPTGGKARSA